MKPRSNGPFLSHLLLAELSLLRDLETTSISCFHQSFRRINVWSLVFREMGEDLVAVGATEATKRFPPMSAPAILLTSKYFRIERKAGANSHCAGENCVMIRAEDRGIAGPRPFFLRHRRIHIPAIRIQALQWSRETPEKSHGCRRSLNRDAV